MAIFRGFIAIDIKATPQILELETQIAKTGADVKLVDPHNIHVTLKFLGDTDEQQIDDIEQIMKEAVTHIEPFPITLKGTGVFPNHNYLKVIWIGITGGAALEAMAHAIGDRLSEIGFKKESRGFSSHLTIGRVKTARNKTQLLNIIETYAEVEFSIEEVHSIKLKKSELTPKGPIYTTLREVPLQ
jgi:2'-5' RNA ligase